MTDNNYVDLSNKIVLIENADPGYDWIFSMNIAGLVINMVLTRIWYKRPISIPALFNGEQRFEVLKTQIKLCWTVPL